ncbi:hypothetical protein PsYK624_058360 [Phanerochaete sordida]|uniref:Uncharacterized protein n=1 Tax=Phanerochaete sordida TaxID=48140 RepID=A0A9P3G955_9APHY|nr:hypothetical protein PsYK624_058360 [Phanerochaete sordida]
MRRDTWISFRCLRGPAPSRAWIAPRTPFRRTPKSYDHLRLPDLRALDFPSAALIPNIGQLLRNVRPRDVPRTATRVAPTRTRQRIARQGCVPRHRRPFA